MFSYLRREEALTFSFLFMLGSQNFKNKFKELVGIVRTFSTEPQQHSN
jgi:hypothetical protein